MAVPIPCLKCDGLGEFLWRSTIRTCPECEGKGWARSYLIATGLIKSGSVREQPVKSGEGSPAPTEDGPDEWEEA